MSDIWLTPDIGIGTSTCIGTSTAQNKQIMQVDDLFSSTTPTQSSIDGIAASALSNAMNAQQTGNTAEAIKDYKISIGLSPYSDNSVKAYQLLSQIYQKQGNNGSAITLLKQAQEVFPQSDTIDCALGDIYFAQNDYANAIKAYSKATTENPGTSSDNYSLGQAYMAKGDYKSAETQFKMVLQLQPKDSNSYYGLGQLYRKMGKYDEAVIQLNKAISLKPRDTNSHLELGETYEDMKSASKANDQLAILNNEDKSSAALLNAYIGKHSAPKIMLALSSNFNTALGPNTSLSTLDTALTNPNSTNTFSIKFTFNNNMNAASVQNLANWQISRSTSVDQGGAYNFGMPIGSTEIKTSSLPLSVSYDATTRTATVNFQITQNASGNGTIDPEHIKFKFNGVDAYGNAMDTSANQYDGLSRIF